MDSRPFLHYMQYLTFGGLGLRHRQQQALLSLGNSILDDHAHDQVFHTETVLRLAAHCWEMENQPDMALFFYLLSQSAMPRNNAANWHIMRLTRIQ